MPDGGGHAADLPVFAFGEFERDPAVRHVLADADGRVARRRVGRGIEPPRAAGQGAAALDDDAAFQRAQGVVVGDVFDLRPVPARVTLRRGAAAGR